ncbi:helix-turn-helix domain-containing protein [Paenibacillus sp. sgz5001063]|uniref:helix-turn-helix domain-containing protein n=1 Tax=Paenibacillus sp. sgz5001063 TaxID=3242474 RepID=UPI0036D3D267
MKNQLQLLAASLILGLSIIIGCVIISSDRPANSGQKADAQDMDNKLLLTLQETATLLGISEDQVKNIMKAENSLLRNDGAFGGMKLQYIKVDDQFLFSKTGLLEWIQAAISEKGVYIGPKMVN